MNKTTLLKGLHFLKINIVIVLVFSKKWGRLTDFAIFIILTLKNFGIVEQTHICNPSPLPPLGLLKKRSKYEFWQCDSRVELSLCMKVTNSMLVFSTKGNTLDSRF